MPLVQKLSYAGPLCLYLPEAVYAWIDAVAGRTNADPYEELRAEADRLIVFYADQLGIQASANGTAGWASYQGRLATGLLYHWWRFSEKQVAIPTVAEVVRLVQSRRVAYGRVEQDILSEIVIAEGYCQLDPAAASRFLADYSHAVAAAASQAGGRVRSRSSKTSLGRLSFPVPIARPSSHFTQAKRPLSPGSAWLCVVNGSPVCGLGGASSWDNDNGQSGSHVTSGLPLEDKERLAMQPDQGLRRSFPWGNQQLSRRHRSCQRNRNVMNCWRP